MPKAPLKTQKTNHSSVKQSSGNGSKRVEEQPLGFPRLTDIKTTAKAYGMDVPKKSSKRDEPVDLTKYYGKEWFAAQEERNKKNSGVKLPPIVKKPDESAQGVEPRTTNPWQRPGRTLVASNQSSLQTQSSNSETQRNDTKLATSDSESSQVGARKQESSNDEPSVVDDEQTSQTPIVETQVESTVDAHAERSQKARETIDAIKNDGVAFDAEMDAYNQAFEPTEEAFRKTFVQPVVMAEFFPLISRQVFTKAQSEAFDATSWSRTRERGVLCTAARSAVDNALAEAAPTNATGTQSNAEGEWKAIRKQQVQRSDLTMEVAEETARKLIDRSVIDLLRTNEESSGHLSKWTWQKHQGAYSDARHRAEKAATVNATNLRLTSVSDLRFDGFGVKRCPPPEAENLEVLESIHTQLLDARVGYGLLAKRLESAIAVEAANVITVEKRSEILDEVKTHYHLGKLDSGSDEDQATIREGAKLAENTAEIRDAVAKNVALTAIEQSLSTWAQSRGKGLNERVKQIGDYAAIQMTLKIPIPVPGVKIVLTLSGEIERTEEGVVLKIQGAVGGEFGVVGLLSAQATFGGYVEARGKDAVHALELMGYYFYKRGTVLHHWSDSIWGVSDVAGSAAKWAAYVESKMNDDHYVEGAAQLNGKVSLGDTGLFGVEAAGTASTGTRFIERGTQSNDVRGYSITIGGGFGGFALSGCLSQMTYRTGPDDPSPKTKKTITIECSYDAQTMGGVAHLVNPAIALVAKLNDKLRSRKEAERDGGQQNPNVPTKEKEEKHVDDAEMRQLFLNALTMEATTIASDMKEESSELQPVVEKIENGEEITLEEEETLIKEGDWKHMRNREDIRKKLECLKNTGKMSESELKAQEQIANSLHPINQEASQFADETKKRLAIKPYDDAHQAVTKGVVNLAKQSDIKPELEISGSNNVKIVFELEWSNGEGPEVGVSLKAEHGKSVGVSFFDLFGAKAEWAAGKKYDLKRFALLP